MLVAQRHSLSKHISVEEQYLPSDTCNVTWVPGNMTSQNITIDSGSYCGDASGGDNNEFPEIRRVGCAFAQMNDESELNFAAHFPLQEKSKLYLEENCTHLFNLLLKPCMAQT